MYWNSVNFLYQTVIWTLQKLLKTSLTSLISKLLTNKLWNTSPIETSPIACSSNPKGIEISNFKKNLLVSLDQKFIWIHWKLLKTSLRNFGPNRNESEQWHLHMMKSLMTKLWNPSPIQALPLRIDKTTKIALWRTLFLWPFDQGLRKFSQWSHHMDPIEASKNIHDHFDTKLVSHVHGITSRNKRWLASPSELNIFAKHKKFTIREVGFTFAS